LIRSGREENSSLAIWPSAHTIYACQLGGISVQIKGSDVVVVLTHLSGGQAGQREVLDQERIRLGRALDNDVIFTSQDLRTSAHHGEMVLDGDQFIIQDLQSTNGTYLNGSRIERSSLRDGYIIQLGRKGPQLLFELKPKNDAHQLQKPWTKGTTISPSAKLTIEPISQALAGQPRRIGLQTMQLAIDSAVKKSSSKLRRLVAVLALITLGALGTMVYLSVLKPSAETLPVDSAQRFAMIARRNQSAVVLIQLDFALVDQQGGVVSEGRSEGTGFAFDARGYIATNYHIVQPWEFDESLQRYQAKPQIRSIKVIFADRTAKEAVPATLYRGSKELDVAVLNISPQPGMPLIEGIDLRLEGVRQGDEVAFIGFPFGSDLLNTTHQEKATTTMKRTSVSKVTDDLIQLDTPVQTGFSGSPIFNRDGKAIGLVTAEIKDDIDSKSLSIGLGTPIKCAVSLLGEG
jgi:S1-C subfamily serine protease